MKSKRRKKQWKEIARYECRRIKIRIQRCVIWKRGFMHGFYGIFTRPDKGITTSLENVQHVMHVTGTSERAIPREKVDKKRNKENK